MHNRRGFLKTVGGVTAGMLAMGPVANTLAQPGRREVTLDGRRITVVDAHAHGAIEGVYDVTRGTRFEDTIDDEDRIAGRVALMNARGIDISVLSVNQYWWYEAERDLARRIIRAQDEGLARWSERYPNRLAALSSPALQFPELAAEQLDYAVNELGLRGASIGGHVNGETPTSRRFDPFWAKCEELDVPVLMHPDGALNLVRENAYGSRGDLENIIGNPLETTYFLSRMIFDGTFDRFPQLKIIGAHGAGYLPSYLARTDVACEVREDANCLNEKTPRDYVQTQIYADSMVFTEEGLRHLVAEMGASQIVYGTDQPHHWPDTLDVVLESPSLSFEQKRDILGGNLIRLLKLET